MKSIYGFGGVTFIYVDNPVVFDLINGKGEIEFVPEFWRKETLNRKVLKKLIGYRVNITIKLKNITAEDYQTFGDMINLLNQAIANDDTVSIYPRADWNSMYNLVFECFLNSKIKFDDKAIIEAGQGLELEFESKELISSIPFLVHQEINDYLLTEGGDKLLQENGDKLIVER